MRFFRVNNQTSLRRIMVFFITYAYIFVGAVEYLERLLKSVSRAVRLSICIHVTTQ